MVRRLHGNKEQAEARMGAFDLLPRAVRDFMNGSFSDFPAADIYRYYRMHGEERTLAGLRNGEVRNIERYRRSLEEGV